MEKKEVFNKLIKALELKVGNKIVLTLRNTYFSKSIKKGKYVKVTYIPRIYELFEDSDGYYFLQKLEDDSYLEQKYTYHLLFDNFERYEDALYFKKTVIIYPTREQYYRSLKKEK